MPGSRYKFLLDFLKQGAPRAQAPWTRQQRCNVLVFICRLHCCQLAQYCVIFWPAPLIKISPASLITRPTSPAAASHSMPSCSCPCCIPLLIRARNQGQVWQASTEETVVHVPARLAQPHICECMLTQTFEALLHASTSVCSRAHPLTYTQPRLVPPVPLATAIPGLPPARSQGVSSVLGEPGADLSTVLGLDFNEAVTGSAATVTLDVMGPCGDCKVGPILCGLQWDRKVCSLAQQHPCSSDILARRYLPKVAIVPHSCSHAVIQS